MHWYTVKKRSTGQPARHVMLRYRAWRIISCRLRFGRGRGGGGNSHCSRYSHLRGEKMVTGEERSLLRVARVAIPGSGAQERTPGIKRELTDQYAMSLWVKANLRQYVNQCRTIHEATVGECVPSRITKISPTVGMKCWSIAINTADAFSFPFHCKGYIPIRGEGVLALD